MKPRAWRRAADVGLDNVTFLASDAQTHEFGGDLFDVVVSRFGVMFFDDSDAAFANIARSVRPGGRLAFVCWQDAGPNEQTEQALAAVSDVFIAHSTEEGVAFAAAAWLASATNPFVCPL